MGALITFSDGALFSDGAGFTFRRPQPFAIITRPRVRVFWDEATRHVGVYGGGPARLRTIIITDRSGGAGYDLWLTGASGAGVKGWLETDGRPLPVRWAPLHGLDADDAIVWATRTFGLDNARKFRAALAETCAQAWADLPR